MYDLDKITDEIWHDLYGKVDQQAICQAITLASQKYQDATILNFIPIFVRRDAMEILRRNM